MPQYSPVPKSVGSFQSRLTSQNTPMKTRTPASVSSTRSRSSIRSTLAGWEMPHLARLAPPGWWKWSDTAGLNPAAYGHAGSNPAPGMNVSAGHGTIRGEQRGAVHDVALGDGRLREAEAIEHGAEDDQSGDDHGSARGLQARYPAP